MKKRKRNSIKKAVVKMLIDSYFAKPIEDIQYQYQINTKYGPLQISIDHLHYESDLFTMFCKFKKTKEQCPENPYITDYSSKYNIHFVLGPSEYQHELTEEECISRVKDHLSFS